jgi:hypothetical protein
MGSELELESGLKLNLFVNLYNLFAGLFQKSRSRRGLKSDKGW